MRGRDREREMSTGDVGCVQWDGMDRIETRRINIRKAVARGAPSQANPVGRGRGRAKGRGRAHTRVAVGAARALVPSHLPLPLPLPAPLGRLTGCSPAAAHLALPPFSQLARWLELHPAAGPLERLRGVIWIPPSPTPRRRSTIRRQTHRTKL